MSNKKSLLDKTKEKLGLKKNDEPLPKSDSIEIKDVSDTAPQMPESLSDAIKQGGEEHKPHERTVEARANKNKYIDKLRNRGKGKGTND